MSSMESLPFVVIKRIALYLSPYELMACSAVSKKLREIFNSDSIWTPHLMFLENYYSIQDKYKDMILCPPYFQTLPPLCTARKCYIRDQCLRFNCRAGLFTVEGFKPKSSENIRQIIDVLDEEGNYWLFINTVETIEVWNITNKPKFQTHTVKRISHHIDSLYILNRKVFLVFAIFVHVFSFEHPKYELNLQWCFTMDSDDPTVCLQEYRPSQHNIKHIVNGNILIGFTGAVPKTHLQNAHMHIWNLETSVKLKSINIVPEHLIQYLLIADPTSYKGVVRFDIFKGDSNNIIIVLHEEGEDTLTRFTIFNTESLDFVYLGTRPLRFTILWCRIINTNVLLFGYSGRSGYLLNVIDNNGTEIVMKHLNRFGIDGNSQIVYKNTDIYIKTAEEVICIKYKDGKIIFHNLLEDTGFANEFVVNINLYIFSTSAQGPVKMWDTDHKSLIKDMPLIKGKMDVMRMTSIKHVHFPPKITYINEQNKIINILSFW